MNLSFITTKKLVSSAKCQIKESDNSTQILSFLIQKYQLFQASKWKEREIFFLNASILFIEYILDNANYVSLLKLKSNKIGQRLARKIKNEKKNTKNTTT